VVTRVLCEYGGLDEERIRKYVKWQNKKEQEAEGKQGFLFA
jgi:ribosomal protein L37E